MATQYPTDYPPALLDGFSIQVQSGVIRSGNMGPTSQRRLHNTMPHTFNLSFSMTLAQWANWQAWVEANAYSWFELRIPSMYSGRTYDVVGATLLRFISPVTIDQMTADDVRATVTAEIAPSMISQYIENL